MVEPAVGIYTVYIILLDRTRPVDGQLYSRYMRLKQGIYLPELLERVSAGEVLEADSDLLSSVYFALFSFVISYNNKKVGALFGCNVTFCVPNQHL